jgi:hypothetical protein
VQAIHAADWGYERVGSYDLFVINCPAEGAAGSDQPVRERSGGRNRLVLAVAANAAQQDGGEVFAHDRG